MVYTVVVGAQQHPLGPLKMNPPQVFLVQTVQLRCVLSYFLQNTVKREPDDTDEVTECVLPFLTHNLVSSQLRKLCLVNK